MQNIGGQAVIEGVMMKSRRAWAVAVRGPSGEIHIKKERLSELPRIFKLPVLRGFIALGHALILGISALEYSAQMAYEDGEEKPLTPTAIAITIGTSLLLGVALFIALPLYATKLIGLLVASVSTSSVMFNLVDGVVRVIVFLLYVVGIGMWSEIRRVFEYHGAEHKVIHAMEDGREMDPGAMEDISPLHPRCGTSFLLIVMIISIMVFSFIPQSWSLWAKFLSRVILMPLVAGISYETLKYSAKIQDTPLGAAMVKPGLMLQKLTAKEPDAKQIEVALTALEVVLEMEREADREEAGDAPDKADKSDVETGEDGDGDD